MSSRLCWLITLAICNDPCWHAVAVDDDRFAVGLETDRRARRRVVAVTGVQIQQWLEYTYENGVFKDVIDDQLQDIQAEMRKIADVKLRVKELNATYEDITPKNQWMLMVP